jgi:hypothetical protein
MKRTFRQKYILRIIAFAVFALALTNISLPLIQQYNLEVREKQNELAREAGVPNTGVSFALYSMTDPGKDLNVILTFTLTAMFLSLILTKRVFLSFLFSLILIIQIFAAILLMASLRGRGFYFVENNHFRAVIIACLLSLSFWIAVKVCRFYNRRCKAKPFLE